MKPVRIAVIGLGKIARDQHLPVIADSPDLDLVATVSRHGGAGDAAHFASLDALLAQGPEVDAVALCTPPAVRVALAITAVEAGKHVLVEKPPGTGLAELTPLIDIAAARGRTLFQTWHARFAPAVEPAREALAERAIRRVEVIWKEDVRVWHPGQRWIFEPGGLGVFDPAINALSILTHILPRPFALKEADLAFPENCDAPIAATLRFLDTDGLEITADLDFLQEGPQRWDIRVETDDGLFVLAGGGRRLTRNGDVLIEQPEREYHGLYRRFVELIAARSSETDFVPFVHVADAFLLGRRRTVAPFDDPATQP